MKKKSISRSAETEFLSLTEIAFFLIFPGFFIYHFLIGKEYITSFLGGYSTSIAVILAPFMLVIYCRTIINNRKNFLFIDFLFLIFLAYFIAITVINLLIGTDVTIANTLLATVPQFLVLFIVVKLIDPGRPVFKNCLIGFYILLTLLIFFNVQDGQFVAANLNVQSTEDRLADYQSFAFVYIVIALYVVTNLQSSISRFLVYLTAMFALFLNGARSEFAGFCLCIPIVEFCFSRHKSLFFIFGLTALLIGVSSTAFIVEMLPENRVLMILKEYRGDDSVIERENLLRVALDTIYNNPFFGSFASYRPGEYAHNIISAWVDLGLLGFFIYVILLVVPAANMVFIFNKFSKDSDYILALCFLFLIVFLVILAKHFTYQMLPVALAAYARVVTTGRSLAYRSVVRA